MAKKSVKRKQRMVEAEPAPTNGDKARIAQLEEEAKTRDKEISTLKGDKAKLAKVNAAFEAREGAARGFDLNTCTAEQLEREIRRYIKKTVDPEKETGYRKNLPNKKKERCGKLLRKWQELTGKRREPIHGWDTSVLVGGIDKSSVANITTLRKDE